MVADMKAVAVWPEGKELFLLPSGRGRCTVYFRPLTAVAMIPTDRASETSILGHEFMLSYPHAFMTTISPAGEY
jgi:hypothetical protein